MEGSDNNTAATSRMNMEEDCFNSSASMSEQKMDLGSGSDLTTAPPPSKGDKLKVAAVGGDVPPSPPTSTLYTLNSDGSVHYDDMPMPCMSKGSPKGTAMQRCSLCKKKLKKSIRGGYPRIKLSTVVDLKTVRTLFPHLSPEDFICRSPCEKWITSKTRPICLSKHQRKRTWIGFSVEDSGCSECLSEENMEGSDNIAAATSSMNMEEDCGNSSASTAEQNMEEDCDTNVPSTSEQNMEEDCDTSVPSTSEQNMEEDCDTNVPSTSEQNMEEDCDNSSASTSEQKMDLGSDLERCSNCKAESLSLKKIEAFIDAKTAKIMFPHLLPADFICMECINMAKTKTENSSHKRTSAESGSSFDNSTPPSKRDKTNATAGVGGVPLLPLASTSMQKPGRRICYVGNLKRILPKPNKDNDNVAEPCRPPMFIPITKGSPPQVIGYKLPTVLPTNWDVRKSANDMPCSSEQSAEGPSSEAVQRTGTSVKTAPPSKRYMEETVKGPPTFMPITKGSPPQVIGYKLPTMLPTNWDVRKSANDMPCSSEQSVEGPSSEAVQRTGTSVKTEPPSKPNGEETVKGPPAFIPITKGSSPQVIGYKLPTVLPTNWDVRKSANDMPCSSEQSAEGHGSEAVQRTGTSVKTALLSKPNMEETVKGPPTFMPITKGSPPQVIGYKLPTMLPTNWDVNESANDMPCSSEQSAEGPSSEAVQRCSICKKAFIKDPKNKGYNRIRISKVVELRTAQVLLPQISPEGFICRDPCEIWLKSKTRPCSKQKNAKRTWKGFYIKDFDKAPDHNYPNTNSVSTSDCPAPAPIDDMPLPSEQSSGGSMRKMTRCAHCKRVIQKDPHGHLPRIKISSLLDLKSAEVLFPHLSPEEFICRDPCIKWVNSRTTAIQNQSKRTWAGFLIESATTTSSKKKYPLPCRKIKKEQHSTSTNSGPISHRQIKRSITSKIVNYVQTGRYVLALKSLLNLEAGKQAFGKVSQEVIRKERIKLSKEKEGPFNMQLTPENLSSFSWKETNAWVEERAPFTVKCLRSMFPEAQTLAASGHAVCPSVVRAEPARAMTEEEAQQLLDKRIGMVTSIALFTRHCTRSFVQSVIGVEMWREGCSEKMFKIMNSLGLARPKISSRKTIVRLQDDHDKGVNLWKGQFEKELKLPQKAIARKSAMAARKERKELPQKITGCKYPLTEVPGYSLNWDRVRIASRAKHERLGGSKPTIWAFRFAHRNRIPFSIQLLQGPAKKAVEVSPHSILPSKQTYEGLRQRMKTIVMRIIVDNLTALEGLRSKVVWHIPHKYSKQMEKKSDIVNLGAVPLNLQSIEGDNEMMGSLIEYVPTLKEKAHQVLCCSDGLNVNTTEEPSESTAPLRFEGLVDAPPEFRKESLCYQDIMKMLCSEKSRGARGSLSQLKSVFAVRGFAVESQVKDTIQRVWSVDFITFVTSAYITLYAATECNLDTVDQQPSDFPTDAKAQMEWLSGLAHRLVDLVWMPPPQEDINTAAATASRSEVRKNDSCFCEQEKPGEPLVQCCSNLCEGGWFHEGCAPIDTTTDPTVTQDWFCSPECQEDGTYIYCYCKEQRGGQMVQCALMDKCRRHEWYHKDCLSLSEQGNADSEESPWYCSEMCFIASDVDDHVLNYTKALVWEGLYNMARRDAIREGDGEAITDFWKMDMVLFWARKHLKDFTTCHRLLTGIEGFYPEHIRQDLKWNRVANLAGKPGDNISLDLVNEFLNVEFKESLGRVSDHYTIEMMERCGMMVGALGNAPDRLLITLGDENGSGLTTSLHPTHYHKAKRRADIATFVADYKSDHLFRYIPGREHQGFEKFAYQQKLKTPKKMGNTIRRLAREMDQHQPTSDRGEQSVSAPQPTPDGGGQSVSATPVTVISSLLCGVCSKDFNSLDELTVHICTSSKKDRRRKENRETHHHLCRKDADD